MTFVALFIHFHTVQTNPSLESCGQIRSLKGLIRRQRVTNPLNSQSEPLEKQAGMCVCDLIWIYRYIAYTIVIEHDDVTRHSL